MLLGKTERGVGHGPPEGVRRGDGLVLEGPEARLEGVVALVHLAGEGGVLLVGGVGAGDGGLHEVGVAGKAAHGVGGPDLRDAEPVEDDLRGAGRLARLAELGHELGEGAGGVLAPLLGELLGAHAGHLGVVLERLGARGHGAVDVVDDAAHGRAAGLGPHTHGRQGRGDAHDVGVGHARLGAGGGEARGHVHDVGLGGGEVVAEVDDGRAEVAGLLLGRARDVHELRELHGSGLGVEVRGDVEAGHGLGEALQALLGDAELAAQALHVEDGLGRHGRGLGHVHGALAQALVLALGGVHGLADVVPGGVDLRRRRHGGGGGRRHGDRDALGERVADAAHGRPEVVELAGRLGELGAGDYVGGADAAPHGDEARGELAHRLLGLPDALAVVAGGDRDGDGRLAHVLGPLDLPQAVLDGLLHGAEHDRVVALHGRHEGTGRAAPRDADGAAGQAPPLVDGAAVGELDGAGPGVGGEDADPGPAVPQLEGRGEGAGEADAVGQRPGVGEHPLGRRPDAAAHVALHRRVERGQLLHELAAAPDADGDAVGRGGALPPVVHAVSHGRPSSPRARPSRGRRRTGPSPP